MADADAQAPERVAQLRDDIPHPVVPARAAPLLEADDAGRKIELVIGYENRLDRHLVEPRHAVHGTSAAVHEAHRLHQPQLLASNARPRNLRVVTRLVAKMGPVAAGELIEQPEPRVMPRASVFVARIAEPDDQLERQG